MGSKYKASRVETATQASQIAIAKEQQRIASEQWAMAKPIYEELAPEARKPVEEQSYFKKMIGQMEGQYGDIGGQMRRTLGGRYQYGSGYEGEAAKNLGLTRARGRASAWQAGEEARRGFLTALASGGTATAQQGYGSAGGMYGDVTGRLANLRATKAGQQTGAISSACCFILAAVEGNKNKVETDDNPRLREVKDFGTEFYPKGGLVCRGYAILGRMIVPMINKHVLIKIFMKWFMVEPARAYAKWHYKKNKYGWSMFPVKLAWVLTWYLIGKYSKTLPYTWEEFEREVA